MKFIKPVCYFKIYILAFLLTSFWIKTPIYATDNLAPDSLFSYINSEYLNKDGESVDITRAKGSFLYLALTKIHQIYVYKKAIPQDFIYITTHNPWSQDIHFLWNTYRYDPATQTHFLRIEINGKIREAAFFDPKLALQVAQIPKLGVEEKDHANLERGFWVYRPDDIIDFTVDWSQFEDGKEHEERRGVDHRAAIIQALHSEAFLAETIRNIYPSKATKPVTERKYRRPIVRPEDIFYDRNLPIKPEAIKRVMVEIGPKGSQKQTYRITINTKYRQTFQFAIKITINRATVDGFRENEIQNLKQLAKSGRVPVFGSFLSGSNYQLFSEEWIHGYTIARLRNNDWLTINNLSTIIASWMAIAKELGQSKKGNWIMVEDVQPPNMMVRIVNNNIWGSPIAVDIGESRPLSPKEIVDNFYKHYSIFFPEKNADQVANAIFEGVCRGLGFQDGYQLLAKVYTSIKESTGKPLYYNALSQFITSVERGTSPIIIDDSPSPSEEPNRLLLLAA